MIYSKLSLIYCQKIQIMITKDIYEQYKWISSFDWTIDNIIPYEAWGKFCDENIVIYVQLDHTSYTIERIRFTWDISSISRSCCNFLIDNYQSKSVNDLLNISLDNFIRTSFVPPHRIKQLLFWFVHVQNAVKKQSGLLDVPSLNQVLEGLEI